MNKNLKNQMIYVLSSCGVVLLLVTLLVVGKVTNQKGEIELPTTGYVYNILNKLSLPVVSEDKGVKIIRPYTDPNVKVVKEYYDYLKTAEEQQNSIIYYEDTYMQSTGVGYSNNGENFNIIAILDGEVVEVIEDQLIGNSVTIDHNGIKSVYQSLSEIDVKVGDQVKQGDIIGVSGTSNINSDLNNHLYFELILNNVNVNPEEYYEQEL